MPDNSTNDRITYIRTLLNNAVKGNDFKMYDNLDQYCRTNYHKTLEEILNE